MRDAGVELVARFQQLTIAALLFQTVLNFLQGCVTGADLLWGQLACRRKEKALDLKCDTWEKSAISAVTQQPHTHIFILVLCQTDREEPCGCQTSSPAHTPPWLWGRRSAPGVTESSHPAWRPSFWEQRSLRSGSPPRVVTCYQESLRFLVVNFLGKSGLPALSSAL